MQKGYYKWNVNTFFINRHLDVLNNSMHSTVGNNWSDTNSTFSFGLTVNISSLTPANNTYTNNPNINFITNIYALPGLYYQEFANVSTPTGGKSTGVYYGDVFENISYVYDGNFSTCAHIGIGIWTGDTNNTYMNYSLPNEFISPYWVKTEEYSGSYLSENKTAIKRRIRPYPADLPPSTAKTWPVTYAASVARYTTRLVTSPGSP